jgi:hypothetical protein
LVSADDPLVLSVSGGGGARFFEVALIQRLRLSAVYQLGWSRAHACRMPHDVRLGLDHRDLARAVDDLDPAVQDLRVLREIGQILARDRPIADRRAPRLEHHLAACAHGKGAGLLWIGHAAIFLAVGHQRPPDDLLDGVREAGRTDP